jgi:protein involved in polysaccharide export with SLBB domain
VIKLAELSKFEGSEYDMRIEDGDMLHIPTVPSSVLVIGNVYNPTAITYKKGKSINYYLAMAGGTTKNADEKEIYVIIVNGSAESHFVQAREIKRGDAIVVPEKFVYKTPAGIIIKDSVSVLSQIATVGILAAALSN